MRLPSAGVEGVAPPPDMSPMTRTAVIINRQSGTVRSMGEEQVRAVTATALPQAEIALVDGSEVDDAIRRAIAAGGLSRLVIGGGDGTLASAAGLVAGSGIALGILPLGTMNMVAKTIGMAPGLADALKQLEDAETREVDAARAGGRLFLHHVSFGLQPRLVRLREKLGYRSRLTKMLAGLRALAAVLVDPRALRLVVNTGSAPQELRTSALIVSNNVYEDAMIPRQRRLDEGILGVYVLAPMSLGVFLHLAFDLLRGRWRDNLNVSESRASAVQILARRRLGRKSRSIKATLDGELALFDLPLTIESQPRALRMLVPRAGPL